MRAAHLNLLTTTAIISSTSTVMIAIVIIRFVAILFAQRVSVPFAFQPMIVEGQIPELTYAPSPEAS